MLFSSLYFKFRYVARSRGCPKQQTFPDEILFRLFQNRSCRGPQGEEPLDAVVLCHVIETRSRNWGHSEKTRWAPPPLLPGGVAARDVRHGEQSPREAPTATRWQREQSDPVTVPESCQLRETGVDWSQIRPR
jgi:hypothetical protein